LIASDRTDIARNAAEAKKMLGRSSYDAMTLDLNLPDQNGISLIQELRRQSKIRDLAIVVVSATAVEGAAEINGDAVAVIDWLEKPIEQDRLLRSVRDAVASKFNSVPRVLHVEDDPDILRIVSAVVAEHVDLSPARNLADAKRLLADETFDLVLLDLGLPDGDGKDLLSLLRRPDGQSTPVIVFLAKDVSRATVESVRAALVKSRTSNELLLDTIRSVIKSDQPAVTACA
jgi:DNA-binding response OmpR family regulator